MTFKLHIVAYDISLKFTEMRPVNSGSCDSTFAIFTISLFRLRVGVDAVPACVNIILDDNFISRLLKKQYAESLESRLSRRLTGSLFWMQSESS